MMRLKTGEMLIVAASRIRVKTALPTYRNRWGIETLFSALKTRDLGLEDTHMTDPHKLATLMSVLAIAFCLTYKTGLWVARIKPPRLKSHGRSQHSLFALGLNAFRKAIVKMSELEIHDYMAALFKPSIPRNPLIEVVLRKESGTVGMALSSWEYNSINQKLLVFVDKCREFFSIVGRNFMTTKKALITGVTGQDGALLAELLLSKGYTVHGVKRRSSSFNTGRVDHLYHDPHQENVRFFMHYGDLTDATNLIRLIQETKPDEIYNLAAQSHVQVSFDTPEYTANADALGTLRLLEAIRILGREKTTRFYQASTSELFGDAPAPQKETTPFQPRSPYAAAKLYSYWIVRNYREAYGMHASNGILFNHEGPTRGETFVTRKITRAVAAIQEGLQDRIYLGNLDACRDWGHARDYVEGMWRIVQHDEPEDFVLCTEETHSVREFVELAFSLIGRTIEWEGEGVAEVGVDADSGDVLVEIDSRYFRPTEVEYLLGDASKARKILGWEHTTPFTDLVREMIENDLKLVKQETTRQNRHD